MSNSSSGLGKFLDFLIELLRALFGISKPATGGALEPQPPVTIPTAPEEIVAGGCGAAACYDSGGAGR